MYRKRLLTAMVIMVMAAVLVGCGNSTAGVETVTEAQTQAVAKQEVTTQQATTAAPTQATTEATTQAETEATTEAPTEAQTEAAVEVVQEAVAETPTEAATEAVTEAATQAASNSMYGKISDETADGYIIHDDWTVTTPIGTFSSVDAYNQATGHTEGNDPEHLTKGGYLYGDKKTRFLDGNSNSVLSGKLWKTTIDELGITDADLAAYNIVWKDRDIY